MNWAAEPEEVPISSTSLGCEIHTSVSSSRPSTGPESIWGAVCVARVSSARRARCSGAAVLSASTYVSISGRTIIALRRWRRRISRPQSVDRVPDSLRELAGDDEHLVGLALGELREDLEVGVAQQALVGVALVDGGEDRVDRLGLAFGAQDRRRLGALGLQDRRLLLALGGEDLRLLDALGGEDRRAAVALGAHLLLHRL